jgi:hypothetical protein
MIAARVCSTEEILAHPPAIVAGDQSKGAEQGWRR